MKNLYKKLCGFDWRLKLHLTFRCNYKCSYCTIPQLEMPKYKELSAKEWYTNINRIKKTVVLTGGEPTLYPEIYELINNIDKDISISLFSNLTFDIKEFAKNVKRDVGFYFSFHPEGGDLKEFEDKILEMKSHKHLSKFSVHSPLRRKIVKEWKPKFNQLRKRGVDIRIDQNFNDIKRKLSSGRGNEVLCERESFLFAPDGSRFMCVKHMMENKYNVGNISDKEKLIPKIQQWCHLYPDCNVCDFMMHCFIRSE